MAVFCDDPARRAQAVAIHAAGHKTAVGHHHVDCALITSDQKTYYFCFGYNRVKEAEHPFFILLKDNWFDGTKLIAQDGWFYQSLSEVMNIQGGFLGQGITVAISNIQVDQAA